MERAATEFALSWHESISGHKFRIRSKRIFGLLEGYFAVVEVALTFTIN